MSPTTTVLLARFRIILGLLSTVGLGILLDWVTIATFDDADGFVLLNNIAKADADPGPVRVRFVPPTGLVPVMTGFDCGDGTVGRVGV
jgi:hypothetical protein